MRFIYKSTAGEAKTSLREQYEADAEDQFGSAQEMLDFLRELYTHPYEEDLAVEAFNELKMLSSGEFVVFKKDFRRLASEAKIPKTAWLKLLKPKLPKRLLKSIELYATLEGIKDFEPYCKLAMTQDQVHQNSLRRPDLVPAKKAAVAPAMRSTGSAGRVQVATPTPGRPSTFVRGASSTPNPPHHGSAPPPNRERSHVSHDSDACHACGQRGHWAKDCLTKGSVNEVEPTEDKDEDGVGKEIDMEGVPIEAFSGYIEQLSENGSA